MYCLKISLLVYPPRLGIQSKPLILEEFPDVFKDTLSATPMNCPPMKIHLVKDFVPYCISTTGQVPLPFQGMVDEVIADLVISKVISR